VLTARVILADEAAEIGLVNRVVPVESLLTEAREMGRAMIECEPEVLDYAKRVLNRGADASMTEAMANERSQSEQLRKRRS
jgi:enoyl-CoA hydratase